MNIIIISNEAGYTDGGCNNVVSFAAYAARRRGEESQPVLWGGDVVSLAEWRCR